MKIIFAINSSAIPNFVLEADSKKRVSKPHAVQQNLCIYYIVCVLRSWNMLVLCVQGHWQCVQNIKQGHYQNTIALAMVFWYWPCKWLFYLHWTYIRLYFKTLL